MTRGHAAGIVPEANQASNELGYYGRVPVGNGHAAAGFNTVFTAGAAAAGLTADFFAAAFLGAAAFFATGFLAAAFLGAAAFFATGLAATFFAGTAFFAAGFFAAVFFAAVAILFLLHVMEKIKVLRLETPLAHRDEPGGLFIGTSMLVVCANEFGTGRTAASPHICSTSAIIGWKQVNFFTRFTPSATFTQQGQ